MGQDGELIIIGENDDLEFQNTSYCVTLSNGKKCSKFAPIIYAEGLRYTIGQKYDSRLTQGEFLLCPEKYIDLSHCQIVCKDEKFWIRNVSKAYQVYVNDKNLNPGQMLELKFGSGIGLTPCLSLDVFSLGMYNISCFLFQKLTRINEGDIKETKSTSKTKEDLSVFSLTNNYLILQKILSFLCPKELKQCRLVSRNWNEEALPLLRQSTQILFRHFETEGIPINYLTSQVFRHAIQMQNFPHPNWRIELWLPTVFWHPILSEATAERQGRYMEDLSWFYSHDFPAISSITSLSLLVITNGQPMMKIFSAILTKAAKTLERLDISFAFFCTHENENDRSEIELPPIPVDSFPCLKTLRVACNFRCPIVNLPCENKVRDWIEQFLKLARGISHIHFQSDKSWDIFLLDPKIEIGDTLSFPHLTGLAIDDFCSEHLGSLQTALALNRKLYILKLYRIRISEEVTEMLEQILTKQSSHLKALALHFLPCEKKLQLAIPQMPCLKELAGIYCNPQGQGEMPKLIFSGKDFILYENDFPKLRKLKVIPAWKDFFSSEIIPIKHSSDSLNKMWEDYKSLFSPCFTEQICTSLRYLEIPYMKVEKDLRDQRIQRICEMFPNVWNKSLTRARELNSNNSFNKRRK